MVEKRPHPDPHSNPHGDKRSRPADPLAAAKAAAEAKAAEIRARIAQKNQSNSTAPPVRSLPTPSASTPLAGSAASKLEALQAKIAAAKAAAANQGVTRPATDSQPSIEPPSTKKADKPQSAPSPNAAPNQEPEKVNPYFDPKTAGITHGRTARGLLFNERGKYLEQGSKVRAQKRLEQIKKMLAQQARRAGLDENSERGFVVEAPPEVEWWDEGLLEDKTYDCLDNPAKVHIDTNDSIITIYVQHPPLLKAPQDQRLIETKPMYLTSKEQAKLRRMRRAEDLKEHQAKIRLGLEPPPPPKVKRGNMMRVMGEQAIADPTAVEMLVESQIAERQATHEQANAERMLTKEQRHAKLEANQQKDADKGLYMCVFRVDSFAFGKHRYQVDQNAKQLALTGIVLLNPSMNLIVVEGGSHAINKYKKLMLQRMKWGENMAPTESQMEKQQTEPEWLRSLDPNGNVKDLSHNKCALVFEGEVKQRAFRKWGLKMCETEGEAKHTLSRSKLDSLWALAKSTG